LAGRYPFFFVSPVSLSSLLVAACVSGLFIYMASYFTSSEICRRARGLRKAGCSIPFGIAGAWMGICWDWDFPCASKWRR
jgi:hypothetical protein